MCITGACLVLFVTFHVLMNAVAIFWPAAYNQVCAFLGANWYALIGSIGLAVLFIIHIIYAIWLTLQNRSARGNNRYAVTSRPASVEWSSNNMLVLGLVVVIFLIIHLCQFWYKMQLQEILSHDPTNWYSADGEILPPAAGTLFIQLAFQNWWTPVVYIIGFAALWFHMNHGFWSMFQTAGWDNNTWLPRLKKISCAWTSIVIALFVIEALVFTYQAKQNAYYDDSQLQKQYTENWQKEVEEISKEATYELSNIDPTDQMALYQKYNEVQQAFTLKLQKLSKALKRQSPLLYNNLDRQGAFGQAQGQADEDEDYSGAYDSYDDTEYATETDMEIYDQPE